MAHLSGTAGMDTITDASSRGQIASRNAYKACFVCCAGAGCLSSTWSACLYFKHCLASTPMRKLKPLPVTEKCQKKMHSSTPTGLLNWKKDKQNYKLQQFPIVIKMPNKNLSKHDACCIWECKQNRKIVIYYLWFIKNWSWTFWEISCWMQRFKKINVHDVTRWASFKQWTNMNNMK